MQHAFLFYFLANFAAALVNRFQGLLGTEDVIGLDIGLIGWCSMGSRIGVGLRSAGVEDTSELGLTLFVSG